MIYIRFKFLTAGLGGQTSPGERVGKNPKDRDSGEGVPHQVKNSDNRYFLFVQFIIGRHSERFTKLSQGITVCPPPA